MRTVLKLVFLLFLGRAVSSTTLNETCHERINDFRPYEQDNCFWTRTTESTTELTSTTWNFPTSSPSSSSVVTSRDPSTESSRVPSSATSLTTEEASPTSSVPTMKSTSRPATTSTSLTTPTRKSSSSSSTTTFPFPTTRTSSSVRTTESTVKTSSTTVPSPSTSKTTTVLEELTTLVKEVSTPSSPTETSSESPSTVGTTKSIVLSTVSTTDQLYSPTYPRSLEQTTVSPVESTSSVPLSLLSSPTVAEPEETVSVSTGKSSLESSTVLTPTSSSTETSGTTDALEQTLSSSTSGTTVSSIELDHPESTVPEKTVSLEESSSVSTTQAPTNSTVTTASKARTLFFESTLPPVTPSDSFSSNKTASSTTEGTTEKKEKMTTVLPDITTSTGEQRTMTDMRSTEPGRTPETTPTLFPTWSETQSASTESLETETESVSSSTASTGTTTDPVTVSSSVPTASPYLDFTTSTSMVHSCAETCPEGTLVGTGNCYSFVHGFFNNKFTSAAGYCAKSQVGHLITRPEMIRDRGILKEWLREWNMTGKFLYLGQVPAIHIDGKVFGAWTVISNVTYGKIMEQVFPAQEPKEEGAALGICSIPQNCGRFSCTFDLLYETLRGQLMMPMPEPIPFNGSITIRCQPPSQTEFHFRCNSKGELFPTQFYKTCAVPHTFNQEVATPGNGPIRTACDQCFRDGTLACTEQNGGYACECLPGWRKFNCWKSPPTCFSQPGNPPKCLNGGSCSALPDSHSCECQKHWGGEDCSLFWSNVSWTGSDGTAAFLTPAKIAMLASTTLSALVYSAKNAVKSMPFVHRPDLTDMATELTWSRTVLLAFASMLTTVYSGPAFFSLNPAGCRIVNFLTTFLWTTIFYYYALEALNSFTTVCGMTRNRWYWPVEGVRGHYQYRKAKSCWYLNKLLLNLAVPLILMAYSFGLSFVLWDKSFDLFTCLGQVVDYNPLTMLPFHLNAIFALSASTLGIGSIVCLKARPERFAEQLAYFEYRSGPYELDRIYRLRRALWIQPVQGLAKLGVWLLQVWAQDLQSKQKTQQELAPLAYSLLVADLVLSLYSVIAFEPTIVEFLTFRFLPLLPVWTRRFFPTLSPCRLFDHEEILSAAQKTVLSANVGYPSSPDEETYVSLERRHQFQRHLTRSYIGMRLRARPQKECFDKITLAVKERFSVWMESEEETQFEFVLDNWLAEMKEADQYNFKIPRTRPADDVEYINRLCSAWVFSAARIAQENHYWRQLRLVYDLMTSIPLERTHSSITRSWRGFIGRSWIWEPQVRHWSQFPALKKKMERHRLAAEENGVKAESVWAELSPELFPDDVEESRKPLDPNRMLKTGAIYFSRMPAVSRYLKMAHLDSLLYQSEKYRMLMEEDRLIAELGRERLHPLVKAVYALFMWKPLPHYGIRRCPLLTKEQRDQREFERKFTIEIINDFDEPEYQDRYTLKVEELNTNALIYKNQVLKSKRKGSPLAPVDPVGIAFCIWMSDYHEDLD